MVEKKIQNRTEKKPCKNTENQNFCIPLPHTLASQTNVYTLLESISKKVYTYPGNFRGGSGLCWYRNMNNLQDMEIVNP